VTRVLGLGLTDEEEVIGRTGDEDLEEEDSDDDFFSDEEFEDDGSEDYEVPALTPEILARMFANMAEHGLL
jgi:hypothetical protein